MKLSNLCLQNVVYRPEDLKRSSTDTLIHGGHKSDTPKANRKGEGDKEKGKPAAVSKSGSRQETVTTTTEHHNPVNNIMFIYFILKDELLELFIICAKWHFPRRTVCVSLDFISLDILIRWHYNTICYILCFSKVKSTAFVISYISLYSLYTFHSIIC